MQPPKLTLEHLSPSTPVHIQTNAYRNTPYRHPEGRHTLQLLSPQKAPGTSRPYRPGDPLGLIDWKAFGRTDQLLVRQSRDQAASTTLFVLASHASMQWPEQAPKLNQALKLLCHMATLYLRLGDRCTIAFYTRPTAAFPEFLWQPQHSHHILQAFTCLAPQFPAKLINSPLFWSRFARCIPHLPKRPDNTIVISDCLGAAPYGPLLAEATRSAMLHTLSPDELDLAWMEPNTLYESPDAAPMSALGKDLRDTPTYAKALQAFLKKIQALTHPKLYLLATPSTPLSTYFNLLQTLLGPHAGLL